MVIVSQYQMFAMPIHFVGIFVLFVFLNLYLVCIYIV